MDRLTEVNRERVHDELQNTVNTMQAATAAGSFRIVCLGGSAGGLQGYLEILRGMPADTGMAFVIAPNRALESAHMLPQILGTATMMAVVEVEDGMRIEPNRVFVMPPRVELTTMGDLFQLRTVQRPRGWPKIINIFLCSLAETQGDRTVAVILSGLDGDGSAALKEIKAAGGVTSAQSDASFGSMPRSAVETGHIDHLLPAAEIAKALVVLATEPLW